MFDSSIDEIKYSFGMDKFLNTIWSTETNPFATYPAREHYKKKRLVSVT